MMEKINLIGDTRIVYFSDSSWRIGVTFYYRVSKTVSFGLAYNYFEFDKESKVVAKNGFDGKLTKEIRYVYEIISFIINTMCL